MRHFLPEDETEVHPLLTMAADAIFIAIPDSEEVRMQEAEDAMLSRFYFESAAETEEEEAILNQARLIVNNRVGDRSGRNISKTLWTLLFNT